MRLDKMDDDVYFMKHAILEAFKARDLDEVPIGAIIVHERKIIGYGYNQKELTVNPINHAEIIAITEACKTINNWRLKDCTLYTTVEPCIMCTGAILHARLKKVVYGCRDFKWGGLITQAKINDIEGLNHHVEVVEGVLKDECSELLSAFFQKKRSRTIEFA